MKWLLVFHIVGLVIWLGGLLDLSRILGYHVKEEIAVQERLSWMEYRMFWFVATPGMAITLIFGLLLFMSGGGVTTYFGSPEKWFHAKALTIILLMIGHFFLGKKLMAQRANPAKINPAPFKALHGILALLFISTLIFVVVRPF